MPHKSGDPSLYPAKPAAGHKPPKGMKPSKKKKKKSLKQLFGR